VERGSVSNPERFYRDDAFASECFEELLAPDLRRQVERGESLDVLRRSYAEADASSELNRLLYIDLRRAITDCDLVKVFRSAKLAGVAVTYPLLDPTLVTFTGRLPASDKVRGLDKRHLFKQATTGLLPPEIIAKKKQGFGLPVSVWMRAKGSLHDMVHDVVFSARARGRGYFNLPHVESLIGRHEKGAWDYSNEIWLLLMLELWHARDVDR
jgi:asparagine synthase (glutamine-hydrolysing)